MSGGRCLNVYLTLTSETYTWIKKRTVLFLHEPNVNESSGCACRSYSLVNEAVGQWKCLAAVSGEWRCRLDDGWRSECAFHLICPVFQPTDGRPFIPLALNSYKWLWKCVEPLSTAGSCWEGIWAALLSGRECVCRVHQSLPSPGELNKLIGRLVAVSSRSVVPIHRKTERRTSWRPVLLFSAGPRTFRLKTHKHKKIKVEK